MRPHKDHQIAVASTPEIRDMLAAWVDEENATRSYLGGYVSRQAVVNGLLLWLASRSGDERKAIMQSSLDMMELLEMGKLGLDDVKAMGGPKGGADRKVVHGRPGAGKAEKRKKAQ